VWAEILGRHLPDTSVQPKDYIKTFVTWKLLYEVYVRWVGRGTDNLLGCVQSENLGYK
jgi:hypothetical protein